LEREQLKMAMRYIIVSCLVGHVSSSCSRVAYVEILLEPGIYKYEYDGATLRVIDLDGDLDGGDAELFRLQLTPDYSSLESGLAGIPSRRK
jgi:hypothetical protein